MTHRDSGDHIPAAGLARIRGAARSAAAALFTLWSVATLGCGGDGSPGVKEISVQELKLLTDSNSDLALIDTRRPEEYESYHVPYVKVLIPHTEIDQSTDMLPQDKEAPVYLICRTGRRSGIAARALSAQGYTNVFNVAGGTNAWRDAGFPVDSGAGVLGTPAP